MPKRKVIEDSDDDDNAETTPPRRRAVALQETNAGTSIVSEDSPGLNDMQQSADPSTGSTELLNRDIRAAHKSLIEPTPDDSLLFTKNASASQGKSQPSPTMSRAKIKRAKTAVEKPRTKKPLKKYGTESNKDIFEFYGDSDGEIQRSTDKVGASRNMASSWGLSTGQTVALEDAGLSHIMPGSRDKPGMSCMPPPTLRSTSQTQTSETNTVATSTDEDRARSMPSKPMATTDGSGPFEPNSSESRMPDPTMSSRGRGEGEQAPDMKTMKGLGDSPVLHRDPTTLGPVELSSSASALSPSKIITVDRINHGPQSLTEDGGIRDDDSLTALAVHHTPEQVKPVILLPELSHGHEETDELSFPSHGPETWSINQTTVSIARKRKKENIPADEPGSDDIDIGLPKDQYQPRPSRSRSGRGAEEVIVPVDFSKRPEAAVKKKSRAKRSKTTAFHELRAKTEVDEEEDTIDYKPTMEAIEEIPTREFGKTEEQDSTEQRAEDEVDEDTQPDPKPIANSAGKKKQRGRPKKEATEAPERKVPRDIDSNELQLDMESEDVQHPALTRKAKTGTKATQAPLPISEELVCDSDDALCDLDNMISNSSNVLHETQGNGTTPSLVEKATILPSPTKIAAFAPAKAMETPPQTPRKADTPTQKGPDKHSPISSGKVAYRVGLSKRARIAPLLRIVRKA